MGFDLKDQFKEHKKILIPGGGLILLTLILGIMSTKGFTPFTIDTGITGNGVNTVLNNNEDKKMYNKAPDMKLKSGADYQATIKTDFGNIIVDLFERETPITVNNFVFLANEKFYDNLTFHRVVKDFVIQGGDPKGNGSGGPGYKFQDEINASALGLDDIKVKEATYLRSFYPSLVSQYAESSIADFYTKALGYKYSEDSGSSTPFSPYVLAMANSGPATNGSQFFITTKTFSGDFLNGKHTVFGKVVSGFDVVDSIENINVKGNDEPTTPVVIKSIQISPK